MHLQGTLQFSSPSSAVQHFARLQQQAVLAHNHRKNLKQRLQRVVCQQFIEAGVRPARIPLRQRIHQHPNRSLSSGGCGLFNVGGLYRALPIHKRKQFVHFACQLPRFRPDGSCQRARSCRAEDSTRCACALHHPLRQLLFFGRHRAEMLHMFCHFARRL